MMLEGMAVHDDSLSNLTCAISNEVISTISSNLVQQPPSKKRRNLPGNPDPEAEVVALSPRALMATNRFVCEICNKGFQRDQNLQLHRRGHNLPWKLKQRSNKEVVKKKVYVCPEVSCVHHDPCRALGDLTGIKKHFSRKHGEKKWKCEKCSKRYAVHSDWKAHSKICGTREYRCDCGTLFSRRDSFITHRAFCDALAEESSRSITQNPIPILSSQTHPNTTFHHLPPPLKQETPLPPWLSSSEFTPQNPISSPTSSFMSATALLQKAAQMGVTMSMPNYQEEMMSRPHHHVGAPGFCATSSSSTTPAGLPSREDIFLHGLASYANKLSNANLTHHDMNINMLHHPTSSNLPSTTTTPFHGSSNFLPFDQDTFNGMMLNTAAPKTTMIQDEMSLRKDGRGGDGMTRDFLGLRAFPHRDFSNMAGFDHMGSSSYDQNQPPWQT